MPKLSYPEYLELEARSERRFEYIAGVVHAMADATLEHSGLKVAMTYHLAVALEGSECRVYGSDLRLRIDAVDRTTYADVFVICGRSIPSPIDPNAYTNPSVIVEVLSPSTEASDRGEKWRHYQRLESLREYVLVSATERRIEVFERDGGDWTSRVSTTGEQFELRSQGLRIAVDQIYARLEPVRRP